MTRPLVLILMFAGFATACSSSGSGSAPQSESGQAVHQYKHVSGVVQGLPAGQTNATLFIQINEIPDFVGPDGRTQQVSRMTLPFHVEPSAASGLKVGDV